MAIYAKVVAPETIVLFEGSPLKIMSVEELYDALDLMLSEIRTVDGLVDAVDLGGIQVSPHFKTKEIQIQKKDTIFLHLFELYRRNLFPDTITIPQYDLGRRMTTRGYWNISSDNDYYDTVHHNHFIMRWFNYDEIKCSMCPLYLDQDCRFMGVDDRELREIIRRLGDKCGSGQAKTSGGQFVCSNCFKQRPHGQFCTVTSELRNACVIEKTWEILFHIKSMISSKNRALKTVQRRMAKLF